jgi:hypothetical protein
MYIPKFFELYELLPKVFYKKYYPHRGNHLWTLFDPKVLQAADGIREEWGPMVANTWNWGGVHQYRGYRPIQGFVAGKTNDAVLTDIVLPTHSKVVIGPGIGTRFSQHVSGRAIDLIPVKADVNEIRGSIINGMYDDPRIRNITAMELDVAWLHIDVRNRNVEKYGIKLFKAI